MLDIIPNDPRDMWTYFLFILFIINVVLYYRTQRLYNKIDERIKCFDDKFFKFERETKKLDNELRCIKSYNKHPLNKIKIAFNRWLERKNII